MDDDLLKKEFINESREHLTTIEADLLTIEEGGANIDENLVNKVFRAAHSIKGGSAFFGLDKIKELAHKAETVLDMLRSCKIAPNAEVTNVLLAAFDKLREMINNTDKSAETDIADLVVGLTGLASSYLPADQKASLHTYATLKGPPGCGQITIPQTDLDRAKRVGQYIYWIDCDLIHDIEQKGQNILALFNSLSLAGEIIDCAVDYDKVGNLDMPVGNRLPLRLVVATILDPTVIGGLFETIAPERIYLLAGPQEHQPPKTGAPLTTPEILPPQTVEGEHPPSGEASPAVKATPLRPSDVSPPAGSTTEDTLRVNVGLLETLMNLAGELVLSRNQLRAAVSQDNRVLLASVNQRVNQVTSELQDVIMQTRLQPIGNVFSKFPRVVRDLSRSLGKEIELDIRGKDVALDKTMIEGLSDPLTHMVRNAVDHGTETTEERIRNGKKPVGHIRIEARHEAGQVVVEIADDGKGIDPNKVADAAVRKGLISLEKVAGLSDRDKQALVFLPGLSTAQEVSEVSGRGVGMDVVKTNLDRLGGQVEISSEIGKGSTFRIKLPLTLAIIPSLIVSLDRERFALPQANIEELLRLRPDELKNRIETVGDSEVLLLRDRVLPLVRLADVLGAVQIYKDPSTGSSEMDRRTRLADRRSRRTVPDGYLEDENEYQPNQARRPEDRRQRASSALEIAVVTMGIMSYGLVVGAFHDTEEIVVKPLGHRFKKLREYSGATILGDGAVALILDASGIAAKVGLTSLDATARAAELAAAAEVQRLQELHSLLLFENGPGEPCAVPLDLVQRIERITSRQVERLGSQRTMQYRGGSLPLVTLSDVANVSSVDGREDLVVLVANARGREVGLLGAMPVDVIETRTAIDQVTHHQRGVAGSTIIRDVTTLIVDLYELVDIVHPDWSQVTPNSRSSPLAAKTAECVLLAEDSDFFRAQVKKYLEEEGLIVLAAPDGEAAWELLLKNLGSVQVVVTDIEMPRLTGLGLAQRIRADDRTAGLPIIAVTSLASDEDMEKGKVAGVNDYQIKLDREKLVASVRGMMSGE
ncbi:MAG TPA: chemotaxis protein CheW [Smithellaceae bacterium]|nr:chemotaxis protein CheW [Smithellaceae bacterium]HQM44904.1 chemotaxis protein CheW [Smithellaceae bacterium]